MQDSFKAILYITLQSERVKGLLEYRPVLFVVDVEPANPNFISKYRNRVEWLAHMKGTTYQQRGQFFTNLDSREEIADFLKNQNDYTWCIIKEQLRDFKGDQFKCQS